VAHLNFIGHRSFCLSEDNKSGFPFVGQPPFPSP
jgi:hypothetical protein